MQILESEFLLDIGLGAAASEPGVERVASGASRLLATGDQWSGLPLRYTHPRSIAADRPFPDINSPSGAYIQSSSQT